MFSGADYASTTHEELVLAEKKMQSQKIPTALLVGFMVGIAMWSATHKGGFILTVGLLAVALWVGSGYSKKLTAIQAEISRRDTVE